MDQITFFGLDLGEHYSQISYYHDGMDDVKSISPWMGSQSLLIPTVVAKRDGINQWFIGDDAMKYPEKVQNLLSLAYRKESVVLDGETYEAMDLLTLFVRRVLAYTGQVSCDMKKDYFLICIDHASQLAIETMLQITQKLGIVSEHVKICSRKEAFCYYVMNQEPELRMNDVLLMDYWLDSFKVYQLHQDRSVSPVVISVNELQVNSMQRIHQQDEMTVDEMNEYKDKVLFQELDGILAGKLISSVYLVGEGFEGQWMKKSLSRLCAGRRVFSGMNLYTKGTCYYGKDYLLNRKDNPSYLYLGGGNLLYNICIKVLHQGEYQYQVLIPAGLNWQDAKGQMEVILTNPEEPSIEITCKSLKDKGDKVVTCNLEGLNVRPDRTTRVSITATAMSRDRVKIVVKDIGFGEIYPSTEKEWNYEIRL